MWCNVLYSIVYLRDNLTCIQPLYVSYNSSGHSYIREAGQRHCTLAVGTRERGEAAALQSLGVHSGERRGWGSLFNGSAYSKVLAGSSLRASRN